VYAEVKRFNWKAIDTRDEEAMRARSLEFVRVGLDGSNIDLQPTRYADRLLSLRLWGGNGQIQSA
jgi:hypothetical protein